MTDGRGRLLIIGFGPGSSAHITERVRQAILESEVIIGYSTYVELVRELLTRQEIISTGMTEEVARAQEAVRQAEAGRTVAVVSSGDAGVYGMAGLVYEVLAERGWKRDTGVEVEVIPGISAIHSCASLLGAPVMHDACTISLSDHLTPWETIARRVEAAAAADFILALYNPRSGRRTRQIMETQRILLQHRSPDTPVGLVKSAYRTSQEVAVTTLGDMLNHDIGMLTTVIIGNSSTFVYEGLMITPRGYERKYALGAAEQPLRPHERLRAEAEPWSLRAKEQDRFSAEEASGAVRTADDVRSNRKQAAPAAALAQEALDRLAAGGREQPAGQASGLPAGWARHSGGALLEIGVAPGMASKTFSPGQLALLAELAGESGQLEYTPHHQLILRTITDDPSALVDRLKAGGLLVFPTGDRAQVKACDFCNLEKKEAIPAAEELNRRIGGLQVPKELRIGLNGCGMACYGAAFEDIGIIYRRGAYDLFLGGKPAGRNAHAAQLVCEGIGAEAIVETVERICLEYARNGHPNERFHKFFKRTGSVAGFAYCEQDGPSLTDAVCGD